MKLVELLAREMDVWPAGCTCGYCVQADKSTEVFFGGPAKSIFLSELADDRANARVTTAQWQAERDKQKGGEWKRHRGRKPPVFGGKVEVKFRDGDVEEWFADSLCWDHGGKGRDIMKYKVISQPQAEEVEVMELAERYNKEQTDHAEVYLSACHEAMAKTDQIDGPIKWRDTIVELDAYIEEFTHERDALINRLEAEGFALIQKINVNLDKIDATLDMSDWRNLKEGDIIECGDEGWSSSWRGSRVTVKAIERADYGGSLPIYGVDEDGDDDWGESYTFISRP